MKAYVLDSNVLVRFLTQDAPAMSRAAKRLFQQAEDGLVELRLDGAIVAEVVFVLTKVYKHRRETVADALLDLIENPGLKLEATVVLRDALKRFRAIPVDFPD